ncbi:MAG: hypothetical protein CMK92_05130 [Pseudomonas sp.]|nr:hypothetical protein [Pseudomonas sp.]
MASPGTLWVDTGLKPLSANKMHYGRKTDTKEYRAYKAEMKRRLPDLNIPEDGPLRIRVLACFSSKLADLDNVLKPLLDTLQDRYGFNDRRVYRITAQKKIVPKGSETIIFAIDQWEGGNTDAPNTKRPNRPTKGRS